MRSIILSADIIRQILNGERSIMLPVKPEPTFIISSARWCYTIPKSKIHNGCCEAVYTASREWWEYLSEDQFPYPVGETVYVRETWQSFYPEEATPRHERGPRSCSGIPAEIAKGHYMYYYYRADGEIPDDPEFGKAMWSPSTTMPKRATRLFLRINSAKAEFFRNRWYWVFDVSRVDRDSIDEMQVSLT